MKGFIKCPKNHFYKETLPSCPYCPDARGGDKRPGDADVTDTIKTADAGKTEYFGATTGVTESFSGDKTKIFTPGSESHQGNVGYGAASSVQMPFDRTFIGGMNESGGKDTHIKGSEATPRASRKIVGWIVSYTLDPMGVDFRIYEGNNSIGREPSNSIKISNDATISGRHATILFKAGKFYVKDEMAANGSFINGVEMEIQKVYELNDNDELRLGNTIFKFKSCD